MWSARLWISLITISSVIMLDGLENSMIAVAVPQIQHAFGLTAAATQWLIGAYLVSYGGFLLLGGRCADLLGRRRTLAAGMALFAAVSLIGIVAGSAELLIGIRFVKGLAAAFTAPAAMSLLTVTFPEGAQRSRAFVIFNLFEASGYSGGLLFGGLLTAISWRATFLVPALIAILLLLLALRFLPADPPRAERVRLDLAGAVTLIGGMLVLVFTVVSADLRWAGIAALLLTAFVAVERRASRPLIRLGIFRNRSLVAANLSIALLNCGVMGFQFLLAVYLQNLAGWQPWQMSLVLTPAALVGIALAPVLGRLLHRYGHRRVLLAGLLGFLPAYGLLLGLRPQPDLWLVLLPSSLLMGIGFALSISALMVLGTAGVADTEQGLASGLLISSLQVGGAFGLAVVTAMIAPGTEHGMLRPGVIALIVFAVLAVIPQIRPSDRGTANPAIPVAAAR
ncbi:MFS transporter [Pseudonocardiaceae bacterium YIM PH 21723]|nr:MFS transporter [Pseudonocardiaceae bacterium YIM PH 21723]